MSGGQSFLRIYLCTTVVTVRKMCASNRILSIKLASPDQQYVKDVLAFSLLLASTIFHVPPPRCVCLGVSAVRECVHCIGFKVLLNRHDYGHIGCAQA